MLRKLYTAYELVKFMYRYPCVMIMGGPPFLRFLTKNRHEQPQGIFSQVGQDSFIAFKYFKWITDPEFTKTYVDVGCNHPTFHNNSYFFERYMNFRVVAVDALATHAKLWEKCRPDANFIVSAVGSAEGLIEFEEIEHDESGRDMYSSVRGMSNKMEKSNKTIHSIEVVTLTNLLKSINLSSIGILSIDVEGYEYEVIQGVDFDYLKPQIVLIENNSNGIMGNDSIRQLMISKGYLYVARIWAMDDVFVRKIIAIPMYEK